MMLSYKAKVVISSILLSCNLVASDFSLVTSLTTSGSMSGGLRYVLPSADCIDFGVSYYDTNGTNTTQPGVWAAYSTGNFGVLLTKEPDKKIEYAGMFSTERNVFDNISIGIGVKVVNVNQDRVLDYFTGWDAYLVVPI